MTHRARTSWPLFIALVAVACSSGSIPQANKSLRPVPVTSVADREAYDLAEAANDQLNLWCKEAHAVRERGDPLAADDPVVDGRAREQIGRLGAAADIARAAELEIALREMIAAQEARLEVLVKGRKFASKRYAEADRKVAELSFGLRRWRLQR